MNKSIYYFFCLLVPLIVFFLYIFSGYITYSDFRVFYTSGDMVRHGMAVDLYNLSTQNYWQRSLFAGIPFQTVLVFFNPPFVALGYVLFSFLSPLIGYSVLLCINIVILLVCLRFVFSNIDRKKWPFFGIFVFFYQPLLVTLIQGQNTPLLFLGMIVSWGLFKKHKSFWAGVAIGLLAIKPQLLLFPLLLFLWKRQWRALAGLGLALSIFLCISVSLVGISGLIAYGRFLLLSTSFGGQYGIHPEYEPTIRGFLQLIFLTRSLPAILLPLFIGIAGMIGVFFWRFRGKWEPRTTKFDKQWGVLIWVIILTSLHTNDYELTLLLFPILMWLNTIKSTKRLYLAGGIIDVVLFPFYIYTSALVPFFVVLLILLLKSFPHETKKIVLDS